MSWDLLRDMCKGVIDVHGFDSPPRRMLGYVSVQWGSYYSMGKSDRSGAIGQCSGVVMTSWGRVDIARTSGYGSVQWCHYDSMGQSDHSKEWVVRVVDIVCFTH